MKKTFLVVTFLVIGATLFSACAAAVPAANDNQADDDSLAALSKLTGIVEQMEGSQWMVAGQTVFVNPAVLGSMLFSIGNEIELEGIINADGSFTATSVKLLAAVNANSNDGNMNDTNSNDGNINDSNSNDSSSNTNSSNPNSNDDSSDRGNSNDDVDDDD